MSDPGKRMRLLCRRGYVLFAAQILMMVLMTALMVWLVVLLLREGGTLSATLALIRPPYR